MAKADEEGVMLSIEARMASSSRTGVHWECGVSRLDSLAVNAFVANAANPRACRRLPSILTLTLTSVASRTLDLQLNDTRISLALYVACCSHVKTL